MEFKNIGLKAADILLPEKNIDLKAWAVIACDQFTSQPEYWKKVKQATGKKPSTLNLIFPEVFLEAEGSDQIIKSIHENMTRYLSNDVLEPMQPGFVLVDRKTPHTPSRKGLVVALDLEKYDYTTGSQTLIRATEGTVADRLPPRIKIRQGSALELPHIMVLIDDPGETVIEPLFKLQLEEIYNFELMMGSGHIKGYRIDDKTIINSIAENISKLADPEIFRQKYDISDKGVLLYAMGDGNHSLATAKAIWENIKQETSDKADVMSHPARYALVELVNVHDEGLKFEPIHRVVFNIDPEDLLCSMKLFFKGVGSEMTHKTFSSKSACIQEMNATNRQDCHIVSFITPDNFGFININRPGLNLEVGSLQMFLDKYMLDNPGSETDYIHGESAVEELGTKPGNMGFFLPAISKHDLFKTVILDGELPRKTFSMGEAEEKRFYVECRKIIP